MAVTGALPELTMRSHDATWNRSRWDALPVGALFADAPDATL